MQQSVYQVFVYGSLRKGFHHPAYAYISRYFTLIAEAKIKGRLYDMGSYPAAIPTDEAFFITGELYKINHPDEFAWAIAQLDDYEGLNAADDEIQLYRREPVTVFVQDREVHAWVYWYNGDTTGKTLIAEGDVLEYMRQKGSH